MLVEVDTNAWLQVFGRFHIVLLHLPIGLIPGMMVLEFGAGVFKKPAPKGALLTLAVLTAVVCGLAFASGWVLGAEPRTAAKEALIGRHKNFAIAMSLICLLLPFMAALRSRRPFRLGLAAALALSVVTGHLGGEAVHKSNFLFKPLERAQEPSGAPQQQRDKPAPNGEDPPPAVAGRYASEIAPILERCCTSCHNPKDYEGDLDLSSRAALMEGWGDGEVIVIASKPDESILIESCELPLDDEMHMPPEDEVQLKPEELAKLRKWIADGCPN
jgi:hypothetical protein